MVKVNRFLKIAQLKLEWVKYYLTIIQQKVQTSLQNATHIGSAMERKVRNFLDLNVPNYSESDRASY